MSEKCSRCKFFEVKRINSVNHDWCRRHWKKTAYIADKYTCGYYLAEDKAPDKLKKGSHMQVIRDVLKRQRWVAHEDLSIVLSGSVQVSQAISRLRRKGYKINTYYELKK